MPSGTSVASHAARWGVAAALLALLLRRLRRGRRPALIEDATLNEEQGPVSREVSELPDSPRAAHQVPRDFYSINPMSVVKEPVVIAMVGLPARGKSYISKAIVRYLNFMGCPARLFNAGNKRRDQGLAGTRVSFFDSENVDAKKQREQFAMETLEDLLAWLRSCQGGCACGIFDATNTTVERRRAVMTRCAQESPPVRLVFLESICNDDAVLRNNYQMKLVNDDYKGADADEALRDFMERVRAYEKVYEPITDDEASSYEANGQKASRFRYVQTFNAGQKLVAAGCDGYIMSHLMPLLHCIHLRPRKVTIVLAGESENDRRGFRGGDTCLSKAGLEYSRSVCRLIKAREGSRQTQVWAGTLRRYTQLVDMLCDTPRLVLKMKVLDEICFGALEGLACGLLRHSFPKEHAKREADKLHYRYPGSGGESYMDLIMRLRECVQAMERVRSDAIVVCDVAVARALLGYFKGIPTTQIPDLWFGPGIIELTRSHSGFEVSTLHVEEGDVSFLARPANGWLRQGTY